MAAAAPDELLVGGGDRADGLLPHTCHTGDCGDAWSSRGAKSGNGHAGLTCAFACGARFRISLALTKFVGIDGGELVGAESSERHL